MSTIASLCLFYLSFTPLWISILFIDIKSIVDGAPAIKTEQYSILAILAFFIIALFVVMLCFNKKRTDGVQAFFIESATEEKAITAEFLLSYVLPLFAFDFTVWHQVVLFLFFYAVLTFLCVRHSYFSVNVFLEIIGYRFYRCELKSGDNRTVSKIVVTKEKLNGRKDERIRLFPINNEYSSDLTDW